MLKITRLEGCVTLVEGAFSGGNIFWVMSWFPVCGSETHFYVLSLFSRDLVSVSTMCQTLCYYQGFSSG